MTAPGCLSADLSPIAVLGAQSPLPPLFFACRGSTQRASPDSQTLAYQAEDVLYGYALEKKSRMRRVLRTITGPILSNLSRMVPTCARANSVPAKPIRRTASMST